MLQAVSRHLVFAVLVFQLAVGMFWGSAQAAQYAELAHPGAVASEGCPDHASGARRGAALSHSSKALTVASHQQLPVKKHDCCRSLSCQCHCSGTAFLCLGLPNTTDVGPSDPLLPVLQASLVTARPENLFKPPIA